MLHVPFDSLVGLNRSQYFFALLETLDQSGICWEYQGTSALEFLGAVDQNWGQESGLEGVSHVILFRVGLA